MEITLNQYLKWIGIKKDIVRYIENDAALKEEVMYRLRACRKKESSKEKILRVFSNYYS